MSPYVLQFFDFQKGSCPAVILEFEIDTFCVITLNFVEIGRTVAEISHVFVFFKWNVKFHFVTLTEITLPKSEIID